MAVKNMSMSDCSKCWDTLCCCGWEYRTWTKEQREDLAASALGVSLSDLREAIQAPERHPKLDDEKWSNSPPKTARVAGEDNLPIVHRCYLIQRRHRTLKDRWHTTGSFRAGAPWRDGRPVNNETMREELAAYQYTWFCYDVRVICPNGVVLKEAPPTTPWVLVADRRPTAADCDKWGDLWLWMPTHAMCGPQVGKLSDLHMATHWQRFNAARTVPEPPHQPSEKS